MSTEHLHLPDDSRIFVFGSNLKGIHGGGAAWYAHKSLGAVMGIGEGLTGRTYALPTCSVPGRSLSLAKIRSHVIKFKWYAEQHPEYHFFVSEVGCGLAGNRPEDIAPMFIGCPDNCDLPPSWKELM